MSSRILVTLCAVAALAATIASPALAVSSGGFASPSLGDTLTGGSTVDVRWSEAAEALRDADEAELVLSLDGGRTFPVRISAEIPPQKTSYRWRVPALTTGSARLALRVGFDRERERLILLSAEFRIAADAPEPEALIRGDSESWTEQALFERTAGDDLGGSVAPDDQHLVAPRLEAEAVRPASAAILAAPVSSAALTDSRIDVRAYRIDPAAAPLLASPLRL